MNEQVQQALDSALQLMQEAHRSVYSGPAGTRCLQALVVVLAKHCLTEDQQRQVEAIVDLHDDCLRFDEKCKSDRGAG